MESLLKELDQEISHTEDALIDTQAEQQDADGSDELSQHPSSPTGEQNLTLTPRLETAWVQHTPVKTEKTVIPASLMGETDQEELTVGRSVSETVEELTGLELKEKMLTDVGEKLEKLLDQNPNSNPNVPVLREMLREADERALGSESEKDEKLVFTIESTKPLFPKAEAVSDTIKVEVRQSEEEDQDQDEYPVKGVSASDPQLELLGSKIPITPSVSINKFMEENDNPSRISSTSTIDDVQELNTHRLQDEFNLLASNDAGPQLPQLPELSLQEYKSSRSQSFNASRIFSVATTNDNYQSAKEYEPSLTGDNRELSEESSLRDLQIPESSTLPSVSTFRLENELFPTSSSMDTVKQDKRMCVTDSDTCDQTFDNMDSVDGIEAIVYTTNHNNENSSLVTTHPTGSYHAEEEKSISNVDLDKENVTSFVTNNRNTPIIELPPLPTMNGLSSMFDGDLFDDNENSQESIDLTSGLKKDNYLSIWHSQQTGGSIVSPALSSNSQFSSQSRTSSVPTTQSSSNSFQFRSRVISPSHVYKQDRFTHSNNDEYVITSTDDSKLDPLRRNTIMSKRIQQQLKTQANLYPFPKKFTIEESSELSVLNEDSVVDKTEELVNEKAGRVISSDHGLTLLPVDSASPDFESFLGILDEEDFDARIAAESRLHPINDLVGTWTHYRKDSFDSVDVKATQLQIASILKKNHEESLHIGSQLLDVQIITRPEYIDDEPKELDVGNKDNHSVQESPSKHVSSPFKIIQRPTTPPRSPTRIGDLESIQISDGYETLKRTNTPSVASMYLEGSGQAHEPQDLPDLGKIYLKLKSLSFIQLQQIKQHHAAFRIEFDNGKEVVETPWKTMPEDSSITLDHEFEVNMDSLDTTFFITLKIRWTSPQNQLVEVMEKVPVKRMFGLRKPKYRLEKRFVTKALKYDTWNFKLAKDGSFAGCQVNINKQILQRIKYQRSELSFEMFNEWERIFDEKNASKYNDDEIWKLPRKPSYKACSIVADVMYIPRSSSMERFPKNLKSVEKCCQKYLEQQKISKEGFLWQEGGDVDGMLKRRYMTLKGTELIAHNELTRKPETLLNLLKVVDIYVDGKTATGKQMRNFTDMVLFSDCFKLFFANDEVINFNADSNALKQEWVEVLCRVVELNKFHQPWIKKVFENERYKIEV